jgi:hypothetical protein
VKIIAAVGLALAGLTAPAQAQNARSFVSAHGLDTNSCALAAPCRTLQRAHDQTNTGGEIDVLDPAGYGSLTINKAISIVNDGVGTAGVIVPSGGTGIVINAGSSDAVSLRGLSIEGGGVGLFGIDLHSGASLTVENCVIRHMNSNGIIFRSTTATSALTVSNSLVADNGTNGIVFGPEGSGSGTAVFNRVEANNNLAGIIVDGANSSGTVNATVSDSVAAGNVNQGFVSSTQSGATAPTSLMVFHSVSANNGYGVFVFNPGATLRLANSAVTGNGHGWVAQTSGVVASYGDNYIDGNGSNTGSLTPIVRQ